MEDDVQDRRRSHDDPELFLELAHEALLGRLVGLELAAGKLPVPREVGASFALRREDAAPALQDSGGDDDGPSHRGTIILS